MGFDFKPKNSSAGYFHIGAFSWPTMLDAGLGLVLGTGKGFRPAEFVYITRPDKKCVQYNDGAKVTATECKELAKVARWIARIEYARVRQWESMPDEERKWIEQGHKELGSSSYYKLPWHPDAIKPFETFADWVEKSGGFTIH